MCVMKWESLAGGCFWENRKLLFGKAESLGWKCKNSGFLHICKPQIYIKLSNHVHQFPFSNATKITCTFPFNRSLAAASTHCNFDFPQNPILRFIKSCPFAPVQSLKNVLDTHCFKFYKRHACAELWTAPRESRGSRPSVCFWLLFAEAESNRKTSLGFFLQK